MSKWNLVEGVHLIAAGYSQMVIPELVCALEAEEEEEAVSTISSAPAGK